MHPESPTGFGAADVMRILALDDVARICEMVAGIQRQGRAAFPDLPD